MGRAVSSNVSKYAPYVDAWELWNEPTSTNPGLATCRPDYLWMNRRFASPIIRQLDPEAKIVLLGGLHLYTGGDHLVLHRIEIAFTSNLSSYNLIQYGDAISVHAYPWGIDSAHQCGIATKIHYTLTAINWAILHLIFG